MKPRVGWYYHQEWACFSEPEYWDGRGTSPLLRGPFKTKKLAYLDQAACHKMDERESKSAFQWCKEKAKQAKDE